MIKKMFKFLTIPAYFFAWYLTFNIYPLRECPTSADPNALCTSNSGTVVYLILIGLGCYYIFKSVKFLKRKHRIKDETQSILTSFSGKETQKNQKDPWNKTISLKQLWSNRSSLSLSIIVIILMFMSGLSVLVVSLAGFRESKSSSLNSSENKATTTSPVPLKNLKIPNFTTQTTSTIQKVTQSVQQPTSIKPSQQTPIIHDGSRTGPIVDYNAYCEHKTIKVYKNELIPFTMPDGQQIYITKADIDCFNRDWPKLQQLKNQTSGSQSTPPSTPSEPLVTCVLSYGTYQLSQSTCDSSKANDKPYTPPQYYPCTLCNPYDGTCKTYDYLYKTKEECEAEQQKRSQEAESIISQHNSQVESCRSRVGSQAEYTQKCNFYSGSAAQACRQLASQQWKAAYDACGTTV